MICVKFGSGCETFDNYKQAKRFCVYELANTGYELFYINKYNKTKGA